MSSRDRLIFSCILPLPMRDEVGEILCLLTVRYRLCALIWRTEPLSFSALSHNSNEPERWLSWASKSLNVYCWRMGILFIIRLWFATFDCDWCERSRGERKNYANKLFPLDFVCSHLEEREWKDDVDITDLEILSSHACKTMLIVSYYDKTVQENSKQNSYSKYIT